MALASELETNTTVPTWPVGPMEDVVQALMEALVDPLLPLRVSNAPPSIDAQKSVAKQMHAVILLYNYHHRKQKPDLKFLDFVEFSKLALVLRPPLIAFMKLMMQNEPMEPKGADDHHLSLTEKAIQDACDISISLNASMEFPNAKEWQISKVAVLLIDSKKENCMLRFGAVTQGVWSLIEKEINEFSVDVVTPAEEKVGNKRKKSCRKGLSSDAEFLQMAYDAVKDVAGIDTSDLEVLESRITYSSSKPKTTALFYMMQYNGSFSVKEQVPLKFLIESLQGPLAEKLAYGFWKTTPVVDYHHMLPYVKLISCWLSRRDCDSTGNNCKDSDCTDDKNCGINVNSSDDVAKGNCDSRNKKCKHSSDGKVASPDNMFHSTTKDGNLADKSDKRCYDIESAKNGSNGILGNLANDSKQDDKEVKDNKALEESNKRCNIVDSAKKEETRTCTEISNKESDESHKGPLSYLTRTCMNDEDASKKPSSKIRVYHHRRKNNSSTPTDDANVRENVVNTKVDMVGLMKSEMLRDEKNSGIKNHATISCNENGVAAPRDQLVHLEDKTTYNVEVSDSEDLQNALALLYRKRQELYLQMCDIEDSLAFYEDNIVRIRDGGEVGLARQCIKSIINRNNNLMLEHGTEIQDKSHHRGEDNSKYKLEKQMKSAETYLPGKSSCQDLEYICLKNNWRLPRYFIEPSHGKFMSDVIVEGKDLRLSSKGVSESKPGEARESAAAQMIAKIQKSCV